MNKKKWKKITTNHKKNSILGTPIYKRLDNELILPAKWNNKSIKLNNYENEETNKLLFIKLIIKKK